MRRTYDYSVGTPLRGMKRAMKHKAKVKREDRRERALVPVDTMVPAPPRKRWTEHDLAQVRARGHKQPDAFRAYFEGDHLGLLGTAGTGKTFLAFYLALRSLCAASVDRLIIIRSTVQARELGFLKGSLEEKAAPFETPYRDVFAELFPELPNSYDDMKRAGLVEFATTSFLRGVTLRNAVVIVEETQNLDFGEINTIMTRIGEGTRVIFTGDTKQDDLTGKRGQAPSGLPLLREVARDVGGMTIVDFDRHDIVRSDFVKRWIIAVEDRLAA